MVLFQQQPMVVQTLGVAILVKGCWVLGHQLLKGVLGRLIGLE